MKWYRWFLLAGICAAVGWIIGWNACERRGGFNIPTVDPCAPEPSAVYQRAVDETLNEVTNLNTELTIKGEPKGWLDAAAIVRERMKDRGTKK